MTASRHLRLWFAIALSCAIIPALTGDAAAQSRDDGARNIVIAQATGQRGHSRPHRRPGKRPGGGTAGGIGIGIGGIIGIIESLPAQSERPRRRKRPKVTHERKSERPRHRRRAAEKPPQKPRKAKARTRTAAVAPIGAVRGEIRQREVLVALAGSAPESLGADLGRELGLGVDTSYVSPLLGLRIVRLTIPDNRSVADVLQRLSRHPDVVSAQPSYVFRASEAAVAAALAVPQYAPKKLRLIEAHRLARGKRVRVAVIDTGVDREHPELEGAIGETFDALDDGKPMAEPHGTAIAGIVAAHSALTGVAPDATIMAARAFRSSDAGAAQSTSLTLLKSIDWVYTTGARVVNMSFAGPEDPLLRQVIDAGTAKGLIFVAAAGNKGPKAPPAYPAAFANVIAVTASDSADAVYAEANRGAYVAVAAPGVDIIAPALDGRYEMSSGTSLAAAHVSGIVALLLERNPDLKPAAVRAALTKSARKPEGVKPASGFGAGIVDAVAAIGAVP